MDILLLPTRTFQALMMRRERARDLDTITIFHHPRLSRMETGNVLGKLKYPALVIQEGGYKTNTLGYYAKYFFEGFYKGRFMKSE